MKKTIGKITAMFIAFFAVIIISNISNAGGLELKNLEYNVQLNSDGTADVVETWRIYIEDTNTLFKTFEIDESKYKEIRDVNVQEVKSTGNIDFAKIYEEKYHVDKNCFYALENKKGQFEIAWGAHAEDTTRIYNISYTIVDAVKNYADCSEFYWQFISKESEIPADKVTGTIYLPQAVANKEDLKVWAHGPLNGNITIESNNKVSFEVHNLEENTMLEARVVTPTNIFASNQNIDNKIKLESILIQEQKWADEANRLREEMIRRQELTKKIMKIIFVVLNIIGIILTIVIIKKIIKYHKKLKEHPVLKPQTEYEYFRDMPDEKATPAQAGFLYYFKNTGLQYNMSKVISATMLDLCLKGYITFEPVEGKKDQIRVILKKKDGEALSQDEQTILGLFKEVANDETNSFTMKEFQKYAQNHSSSVLSRVRLIEEQAKSKQQEKGNYSKEQEKEANKWVGKGVGYIFLAIISVGIMQILFLPSLIAAIYSFRIGGRYNQLTQKGINEKEQWMGLKRYMSEFSLMKEKEVPELVLWEKYLVYATVFGISEKVLKQLKVVYPQITDEEYMTSHGYTYMYLMYSGSFRNSFISTLNTSVNSYYSSATNYSSGSGSGGGFSGGGGFGGGGGRNGRKIEKEGRFIF